MASFSELGNNLYSGRKSINFIGRTRRWYIIAAVMMLISVLALVFRGLTPGIEFSGGTEFRITNTSISSQSVGEQAVTSVVAQAAPRGTKLGGNGMRIQAEHVTEAQLPQVQAALAKAYQVSPSNISTSFVGPTWGADVTRQAVIGLLIFLALVALVIMMYFRTWTMALAALLALLHDLLITAGVYALIGFEVTPASVIGFLTILGYSLYDTVVVFDKVRENTDHVLESNSSKQTFAEAANLAINQTLVRSINTSVVALLPVASILFIGSLVLGAGTLKDISLALFVGIAAGTYSSIFIATPLYVQLRSRDAAVVAQTDKVAKRRALAPKQADTLVGAGVGVGVFSRHPDGEAVTESRVSTASDAAIDLRPSGQRQQPKRKRK